MSDHGQKNDEACECPFCDIILQLRVKMAQAFDLLLDVCFNQFGERPAVIEENGKFSVSACGCAIETTLDEDVLPELLWLTRIHALRLLIASVLQDQAASDAAA